MTGRAGDADRAAGEGPPADAESRGGRRTYVVAAVVAAAVVAATAGTAIVQAAQDPAARSVSAYGVPAAAAGCQPVITDAAGGLESTIGPGTAAPDVTRAPYPTVPPSSGPHTAVPLYPSLPFYGVGDTVRVEQLVHNLAHGYTVLWYDPALPSDQRDQLSDLATAVRAGSPKFIAAPWDTSRGRFAGGAQVALAHWGAAAGYRQLCRQVSGEAVAAFLAAHPASDSPDPAGA